MRIIKKIYLDFKADVLPLNILNSVLRDQSEDARKSLLKRACQKGELVRIKNGLYVVGKDDSKYGYHTFTLANFIQRPSYISLESALSHYNLIPEAVYTTTSVTTQKSLEYQSSVGTFSFTHLKHDYFNLGFYCEKVNNHSYLIATPLKALVDYIVIMKKQYRTLDDIEEDLRFNWDEFFQYKDFDYKEGLDEMLHRFKSHRMQVILKALRKKL